MSTLSEISDAATALREAVDEIKPAILSLCRMASDLLRVDDQVPGEIKQLLDKGDALAEVATATLWEVREKALGALTALEAMAKAYAAGVRLDAAGLQIGDLAITGGVVITPKEKVT